MTDFQKGALFMWVVSLVTDWLILCWRIRREAERERRVEELVPIPRGQGVNDE